MRTLLLLVLSLPEGLFSYLVTRNLLIPYPPTLTIKDNDGKDERATRHTYDLGLGKNLPVTLLTKTLEDHSIQCRDQAVQHWMVSDSVRNFPRPISVSKGEEEPEVVKKVADKKIHPIIPKRFSQDAIDISNAQFEIQAALKVDSNNLDINTIWVEMLIHHEQIIYLKDPSL
jgi:hypothetical protein